MGADHFDYCLHQVRQGDRDRYLTLLFAPAKARGKLAALAAFNLELARTREQVTESLLGLIRLQWWREAIEEISSGGKVRQHQVALALAETVRAHGLHAGRLLAMIDARDSEMESPEAPTEAEFNARADATAGNLLTLSLQVLGHDPFAPEWAKVGSAKVGLAEMALADAVRSVGRAYAAAGIARSVLADARRRHTRLPREALAAAGVDLDRLYELKPQPALAGCLRAVAEQAERDLAAARTFRQAKSTLVLTGRLAALHLERLRRAAYDPFDPAVVAAHPMDAWRLLWSNLTDRF